MNKTVYIYEHGINTFSSEWRNWVNRAIAYTHQTTDARAQGLFYFTTAVTVFFRERERSLACGRLIRSYCDGGWTVDCVGHSNGTKVLLEGLRSQGYPAIRNLHLVCGACDADFEHNGLNKALREDKVGRVFVYVAGKDVAMKVEDTVFGKLLFGLGYDQPLGLRGPIAVDQWFAGRVRLVRRGWDRYGHSTCWQPGKFRQTMDCFLNPAR